MKKNEEICILDLEVFPGFYKLCHFAQDSTIKEIQEAKSKIPDNMVCPCLGELNNRNRKRACPLSSERRKG